MLLSRIVLHDREHAFGGSKFSVATFVQVVLDLKRMSLF